ncbi:REP element-mobilizing transposase RayT [Algoriphagus ornithinivorans]|uniref:REP element-mobilizing transposase RayT n=1 Tax=Algoriphagus ornithinivorans TaxID=226506 RepID=A0A1I5F541_9BACT|nr:transposase [Algoriphagus ornithinivorans]SFO18790.1 REP element-mobilizing transposase RayT [Algoriphagus ornithinivorans]
MPRSSTPFEFGKFYHVWSHAVGDENIFRLKENYKFFLSKYDLYIYPVAKTYAYCLMPNHFHLMIQIRDSIDVNPSRAFSNLLNSYSQAYNKMFDRKGGLFTHNIKRKEIASDDYFTRCITYIHQNPTKHGFIKNFRKWEFSSWTAIYSTRPTKIERHSVLSWFGGVEGFLKDHEIFSSTEDEVLFGK